MTEVPGAVELRIDRPAQGGEFIARLAGRVVLVRGALPGETARVRLADPAAKLLRGTAEEILSASPHRREPGCAAAAAGAGCCDWDFIDPGYAAELKAAVVADALRRIGRLPEAPAPAATALAPATGWRTRTRLGVDAAGRAGLRRRRSRELVTGVDCAQNAPGLTAGLGEPGACPPGGELHAVLDAEGRRHLLHRAAPERGVRGRRRARRPAATVLEGAACAPERVGGRVFEVPVDGFWQAHRAAAAHYAARVRDWLAPAPGEVAWDLYGGVGVLAAALAECVGDAGRVLSVEAAAAAAPAGARALADLPVEFRTGLVEEAVPALPRPAAVVLDPPRTGAGAGTVAGIAAAGPGRVLHIGCDPATFARDLGAWAAAGYRVRRLEAVDAFPGTSHVEALALLEPGA